MKTTLLFIFLSFSFLLQGQTPDTAVVRLEIDSLIQLNKSLLKERKLDEALTVMEEADEKCLTAFGEQTDLYARIAHIIGLIHYYKKEFSRVEIFWLKAKKIREHVLGKEHPSYAASLNNLGIVYNAMGQNEKAEAFYLGGKAIRGKVVGKEHPSYVASLYNLGILYSDMGQYKKAESLYLEVKAIREKIVGKDHLDYAASLNNLAGLYMDMGQYEKAETLYLETKVVKERILSKDHPDYASSLNNLGVLYNNMGQYEKAEAFYLETKAVRERLLGKEHPSYAASLNNLGSLNKNMGLYEKAESLFLEAKTIWEKALGKEHPHYAVSLNNLGVLYYHMGQYEKSEAFYLEGNAIDAKILGKEHPVYATDLNNLGGMYDDIGQYEKAETLYLEAKAIREKALGKEHPDYAASLNNLGVLYMNMGQYEKAETLYLEAKTISEKILGKEHPSYARNLDNLGALYHKMGQYEKAEPLYLEARAIREKGLGKEHPDYGVSLKNLGILYYHMEQYEKSEPLYLETKAIREKVLGKEHPHYVITLNNLGNLYWAMGQYENAEPYYLEANDIRKTLLQKAVRHLSESGLLSYTTTFISEQNLFLSFATRQEVMAGSAFDNSLFYKGLLLSATQQLNRLAQTDSISNELFLHLKGYNRRISTAYSSPLVDRDSSAIAKLEEKANTLEKELTRSVAGFGETLRQVNWQEVQAVLKPGEAAIEFVHYGFYDPAATDSIMYAALLLRSGDEQVQFVPLFEENSLDALLDLHKERRSDYVNDLYAIEDRGAAVLEQSRKSLYELIWQPLESKLEDITKVYFSPSGLLHRINIAAIPLSEEQHLCDQYNLVQVNSTRQLVIPHQNISSSSHALLMGGIQYDLDSLSIKLDRVDSLSIEALASRGVLEFIDSDSTLRGGSWNYLKYTEKEVSAIDEILSTAGFYTTSQTGYNATEELFRQYGQGKTSPRMIHLATHGFFFPDPVNNNKQSAMGNEDPIFKMSDHPMIRSGLILAGGNNVWLGKPNIKGKEDGILTAYEISQMDLSNTELVVLSACETGLGDIQGNEGVYGLQRAFKIAGAKYLIMSLWQVPDRETKDFMVRFYEHLLIDDMSIPDAFRKTQKEMKERFYNPHQWAGFVLVE